MEAEAVRSLPDELADEVRVQRTLRLLRRFPIFEGVTAAYLRQHRIVAPASATSGNPLRPPGSARSPAPAPPRAAGRSHPRATASELRAMHRALDALAGLFLVESGTVGATTADGDPTFEYALRTHDRSGSTFLASLRACVHARACVRVRA